MKPRGARDADYYVDQAIKAIALQAMTLDRARIQTELLRLTELRGETTLPLEDAVSVVLHELPLGGNIGGNHGAKV